MWFENIPDEKLFNRARFLDAARGGTPPLKFCKQLIQDARASLHERFIAGNRIDEVLYRHAWFIDQMLTGAWQSFISEPGASLVAVGGYGRGDLLPASDIDLMILTRPRVNAALRSQIERFLTFLWDIGLQVGHSVRTVRQCVQEAKADVTVVTNLIEARHVCGERPLFDEMTDATGPRRIWPTHKYFRAKFEEQSARHQRYEHSEHNLEPNVKDGPGGLRDIQMVGWVAKRHFGAQRLLDLIGYGFLTESEYQTLDRARALLWRVRFALHATTGRREDRLLFDYQKKVARLFGFTAEGNRGVEQFMRDFYRTARDISRLNEMLLQHFQEVILAAGKREKIEPLNNRFQVHGDSIAVRNEHVFKRYPFALLELFLLIQQNARINGVRASTIRLVRESIHLIDEAFRSDIRNRSLFLEIIRQPRMVGHELRRMHRYGVLGAYLPEFAAVEGLTQFDLFHIYTVDEHLLFVVRNMRLFGLEENSARFPLCRRVLQAVPKQELLYLAGIFHDIGKGRGGDHSELGAVDAETFCRRHQLAEFDSRLVGWLVRHHLLMSKTAQREDIDDPETVNRFATTVRDVMHLNYLFLLTAADMAGTNPGLWNGWKAALLGDLYEKTLRALRRGLENPIDKEERIAEVKAEALALLGRGLPRGLAAESVWGGLGEDYFIRHSPDEIARHTQAIAEHTDTAFPLVLIREITARGGTEIFIYMPDHDNIFSRAVRTMDRLGLNILDARIITSTSGHTLDTFIVLETGGEPVQGHGRVTDIHQRLIRALTSLDQPMARANHVSPRRLRHFDVPTQVLFSTDSMNIRTIMEVIATDRPGFLAAVGMAMENCGARLQGAKIATYGERVEDIFFITDRHNRPLADESQMACLRNAITENLATR
ncbi:MAG: [protein-PII] uridylyltransferase [Gammaproteobacteria bacterium]|nr:[protein-PII] uridylyltransferase [Gammaproteobacteria bacterium]